MSYHPAAAPTAPVRLGRYELLGQLAVGGMAEIHVARLAGEAGFEKIVVVKRLLPELVASKAFVAMFLDEAKLVARLDHPNICEVHELGREGAEYFLVMPYLDGVPATELIGRPRESDRIAQLRVAAGVISQASAGLHHAHELRGPDGELAGLVHRDVSPSNLFVTTSGQVKVLDFGIAKIHGAAETEAGTIKGKTQYMAPEQLLGEPVDRRCDVFALGIVAFELATHQRLFKRASDYLSARAILEDPIPRADAVDPGVPAALADVIARALAREPGERYASARDFGRAIDLAMVPHGGIASRDELVDAIAGEHGEQLSAQRTRQARLIDQARTQITNVPTEVTPARRSKWTLAFVVAVVVAGAAVALVVALGRDPELLVQPGPRPSDAGVKLLAAGSDASMAVGSDLAEQRGSDSASPEPRGSDTPTPEPRGSDAVAVAHKRPPGQFSVDSTPFATIFVDDHNLGITPMIHHALAAGRHRLRAVLRDGRSQELPLEVPAGKAAAPIVLHW